MNRRSLFKSLIGLAASACGVRYRMLNPEWDRAYRIEVAVAYPPVGSNLRPIVLTESERRFDKFNRRIPKYL